MFNENRLPIIEQAAAGEDESAEDEAIAVKDAPDVKLTGVIITSETRIATLTPASGDPEFLMVLAGEPLTGDYLGWNVAEIHPRKVLLRSNDGQRLELALQVHDVAIKAPPKPVAAVSPVQDAETEQEPQVGEDGEPLSRAEQIRQRIAERREQLRQEQEAREAAQDREGQRQPGAARSSYQEAIRGMMNKSRSNDNSDDSDG